MQGLLDLIKRHHLGEVKENQDLRKYTTYRVGGIARHIIMPNSEKALSEIVDYCYEHHIKFNVIGHGSNIIVPNYAFDDPILKLDNLKKLIVRDDYFEVGSGYSLIKLALELARQGIATLTFASGIPGSVGGAIFMNAGAYKEDISDYLISVDVIDTEGVVSTISAEDMEFGYRQSVLKQRRDLLVVSARFKIVKKPVPEILELISSRRRRRLDSQPLKQPSAGSVFRNPFGEQAWQLIDECGLRGETVGGAKVSEKHTNFIINDDQATFEDITKLIEKVQETVREERNINLLLEQEIVDWK
jgi:UDP-N-acetylmuramate dehydrogenase